LLEGRALLSTVVTNNNDSGPGSFRDVVTNAPEGATITFDPSVVGSIVLSSGPVSTPLGEDLTIQGPGASVLTISGNNASSILTTRGKQITISGLTFADGSSKGSGGAILSFATSLSVSDCVFNANHASTGGAIFGAARSSLTLDNDQFTGNSVGSAQTLSGLGLGGAVFAGGTVVVTSSDFEGNQAFGSTGQGGAIQVNFGAILNVTGSRFSDNLAEGKTSAGGGAIFSDAGAVLTVDSSHFTGNTAESAGLGGSGGAISTVPGSNKVTATITNSQFTGNTALGTGQGASGNGGAIQGSQGVLSISGSTFIGNQAVGANSTTDGGGPATGGAVFTESEKLVLGSDTFLNNVAQRASNGLLAA
jgi:hypothetical protein